MFQYLWDKRILKEQKKKDKRRSRKQFNNGLSSNIALLNYVCLCQILLLLLYARSIYTTYTYINAFSYTH